MKQVTFRGTGQLNGPIIINKTIELDDRTASTLTGLKRDGVKLAILAIHYPGVKIKPNQIGCEIIDIRPPKITKIQKNEYENKTNYIKQKSSFSIVNIILWLLFFPFKLAWWLLKKTWNEKHV